MAKDYHKEAKQLVKEGRLEDSLALFDKAIKAKPKDKWPPFDKGKVLVQLERYAEALEFLKMSRDLDKKNTWVYSQLAVAAFNLGRIERAKKSVDIALKLKQDNWEAKETKKKIDLVIELIAKGDELYEEGSEESALKYYDQALEIAPKSAEALNSKGVSLDALGRYKEAIRCFSESIKINSKNAYVWINQGDAFVSMERYNDGVKCYNKAIKIDPNIEIAWFNKGNALQKLGKTRSAKKCYEKAEQLNPDLINPLTGAGYSREALDAIPGLGHADPTERANAIKEYIEYTIGIQLMDTKLEWADIQKKNLDLAIEIVQVEAVDRKLDDRDLMRAAIGLFSKINQMIKKKGVHNPDLEKRIYKFYKISLLDSNSGILWHDLSAGIEHRKDISGFSELIEKVYLRFSKLKKSIEGKKDREAMQLYDNLYDPIIYIRLALAKVPKAEKGKKEAIREAHRELIDEKYSDSATADYRYEFHSTHIAKQEFLPYLRDKNKSIRDTMMNQFKDDRFAEKLDSIKHGKEPSNLEFLLKESGILLTYAKIEKLGKYIKEKAESM